MPGPEGTAVCGGQAESESRRALASGWGQPRGAGRASFGLVAHRNSAAAVPLHHDDDRLL